MTRLGMRRKGRGRGGITPTHSILGTRKGVGSQQYTPAILSTGRIGTNYTGGQAGIEACLDGTENLVHTGIPSPDRSARSV